VRDLRPKSDLVVLALILSVSAVVAYGYLTRVDRPYLEPRIGLHSRIIEGSAPSPYRYRVLVPLIAEVAIRGLSTAIPYERAFLLSYAMYDLLGVFFILVMLFLWLEKWFPRAWALSGVLFVAATMPIALRDHYFQPWSLLETALFSASLLAIYGERYGLLAFLLMLASLNREMAVFIPLAFLVTRVDVGGILRQRGRIDWRPVLLFVALLVEWAAIYLAIRYVQGEAPHIHTVGELLRVNLTREGLFLALVNGTLFLGGFWVLAVFGYRYAPGFIKRLTLIIPMYLMVIGIWGVWYEVRLLMPLYPVLLPLGLSFACRSEWGGGATDR